jgi:uncharacterized membrane protein (DUF485 family)
MLKPTETIKPVHRDDWERFAASSAFRELLRRKRAFVVPATVFFIVYYFALPVLVGYFPEFMNRKVLGAVNIAYLFALSPGLYVRAANRFDRMAQDVTRTGAPR